MFYIVNIQRPYNEHDIGSVEFQRIIRRYVIDVSELTFDQYQTFKGTLYAFDLLDELVPSDISRYVVRFCLDA